MKRLWRWVEGELPSFETVMVFGALAFGLIVGYFVGYDRGEWNRMLYEMDRRAPPKKTEAKAQSEWKDERSGEPSMPAKQRGPIGWSGSDDPEYVMPGGMPIHREQEVNPNGVGPNDAGLFWEMWK